jgi:hypothetical protein
MRGRAVVSTTPGIVPLGGNSKLILKSIEFSFAGFHLSLKEGCFCQY